MTWPRLPRRICRQCQRQRCARAGHQFCSLACTYAAQRKPRQLCPVCRVQPVGGKWGQKTCGRSCGAKARGEEGQRTRAKGMARMAVARRAATTKRIASCLRAELAPLVSRVPIAELAAVASKIYRKGYANGASAMYYKYAVAARKRA